MVRFSIQRCTQFRESFVSAFAHLGSKSWYPGHMYKGVLQMQAKLAVVDCILEVHDARIPFSGRNPKFYSMLTAVKPHILVLNKSDLIEPSLKKKITVELQKTNVQNVLFTDCKASIKGGVNKVVPTAIDLIKNSENYNRENSRNFSLMVIGIPNVGKSSLINRLRNIHLNRKKASAVGATPGITKSVLEKIKICDDPSIYLFDTPGVVEPSIKNMEVGLKLALCRNLKDNLVGEELMADYLLYWLNKHKNFTYVKHFDLPEVTDDIRVVLFYIAKNQNLVKKIRNAEGTVQQYPDILTSAMHFITAFRDGKFGKILLDIDHLD
ncbi:mitochondrial GTPase 1-like [Argiope bruennichi]|uniref:mitochondrial GTPase 1-like n=1 Tax=Argiope bruennichi TaxID=94029 RepID=UPI0024957A24|nr:mitochondrial GTPase 1-like [Argiope bruennichi]